MAFGRHVRQLVMVLDSLCALSRTIRHTRTALRVCQRPGQVWDDEFASL